MLLAKNAARAASLALQRSCLAPRIEHGLQMLRVTPIAGLSSAWGPTAQAAQVHMHGLADLVPAPPRFAFC